MSSQERDYNAPYTGNHLDHVAFPLGGLGTGMVCLEGSGALSQVSLYHQPNVFNEPLIFSALCIKGTSGNVARVLEGPVPSWKLSLPGSANGGGGKSYGLPRFARASFQARFPFGVVSLDDPKLPVSVELTGWSPFAPNAADDSSLPVASLEYTFHNRSDRRIEAVYSFHARNFMHGSLLKDVPPTEHPTHGVRRATQGPGFVLYQNGTSARPWLEGSFLAATDAPGATANCRWFRGGWFDPLTLAWKSIVDGQVLDAPAYDEGDPSPGGSLFVPFALEPGARTTVRLRLSWYIPKANYRHGPGLDDKALAASSAGGGCGCSDGSCNTPAPQERPNHRPWYAGRFDSVDAVDAFWLKNYDRLRERSRGFSDCFYDTTLPAEVVEAVAANLVILKSPTCLRQPDGRLWLWEGCIDTAGCCSGSCTHVWNYAQAICHLFPALERGLRETEFGDNQDDHGHQAFRACLPIRPVAHDFYAAADGQLGGIIKLYRDWRISGDTEWLRRLWPAAKQSLDYCITTWDPDREGMLKEPHHNTYDIEFWGPDGMCGSFYATALQAACLMGKALDEPTPAYAELLDKAKAYLESDLYDGEYFIQKIRWTDLHAPDPVTASERIKGINAKPYSTEAKAVLSTEGPKYQYGTGCLSDGVLGAWMGTVSGLGNVLDDAKVRSHLRAVHTYNFRADLSEHANPQRPTYALGNEAGLLLCSWPKGGALTLPMVYSDEVWTGIEYQVAAHLMMMGCVEQGLQIVRALRDRYDGRVRNPFDEYECGHWYGRAMASYALLQGLTGQRYDAVERTLYLAPRIEGDWRSFLSTATGYGTVGIRNGKPFVDVKHGTIDVRRIEVQAG